MRDFRLSIIVTILGCTAAFLYAGPAAAFIALVLGVLEVSLSFDNAVVNAGVLKDMPPVWQRRFLTWGILIAVFGMRLLFPVLLVAVVASMHLLDVVRLALEQPEQYAHHLESAHVQIAAFGGSFLFLVFFSFFLDEEKDVHWIGVIEERLTAMGKLESMEVLLGLLVVLVAQWLVPQEIRMEVLLPGVCGVVLFVAVKALEDILGGEEHEGQLQRAGVGAFLYLEILDASFSFDGVIGAFAITTDVVIIMLGLMIGAMFVRSLTVHLVRRGTLEQYIYLEHGAHYAIGALALLMYISILQPVPEVITGLVGAGLIMLSFFSSMQYNRRQRLEHQH